MKISSVIGLVLLFLAIILLLIFGYWVYQLKPPKPGTDCKKRSDWVWADNCLHFKEKFFDSSLKSPKNIKPYLVNFTYARGGGSPLYLPMWYRFRYVDTKTGGYSEFSDWTKTPIISGSCCLPCPKGMGNCPTTGYETCSFNQPTIGVSSKDSQYSPTRPQPNLHFIYINLHRYVGKTPTETEQPPKNVQDKIIGFLSPGNSIDGVQYYTWTDVLSNPCTGVQCSVPSWCQHKSDCNTICI